MSTARPTATTPLRQILRDRGHGSLTDLAEQVDVTREHLSGIASGRLTPSWSLKQKIADKLGREIEDLWPTT